MSGFFANIGATVLAGEVLAADDAYVLGRMAAEAEGADARALYEAAHAVKRAHFGDRVGLCAIVNAKSGSCSEDCKFCAQSAHYPGRCEEYGFIDVARILDGARRMRDAGATRYSVVTSGKGLSGADFAKLKQAVAGIRDLGLAADASVGILRPEQLEELRGAGLAAYHHNLETARSYFPEVCTTHEYDEDVATVRAALDAGLYVCSGGLFGIGEGWDHRVELALELRGLGVQSVPVNFLSPIPGTPYEGRDVLTPEEAKKIVAVLRLILPGRHIRICGGRPAVFGPRKAEVLACGASGLMIGDYLTTKGESAASDLEDMRRLGLVPEDGPGPARRPQHDTGDGDA